MNPNLLREREKDKERDYEQEDSNNSIQQKQKTMTNNYSKRNGNPDYLFFDSLKKTMDEISYKVLNKLLHLYVEVEIQIKLFKVFKCPIIIFIDFSKINIYFFYFIRGVFIYNLIF
jgi:hypothetical protein